MGYGATSRLDYFVRTETFAGSKSWHR